MSRNRPKTHPVGAANIKEDQYQYLMRRRERRRAARPGPTSTSPPADR